MKTNWPVHSARFSTPSARRDCLPGFFILGAAILVLWLGKVGAAETNSVPDKGAAPVPSSAQASKPAATVVTRKLTGAELYAVHCNRCHSERYPVEMNDAHWKTLVTHMRVRANLPAEQTRTIMKYMQEEAGN